jgi:hypothetical protein
VPLEERIAKEVFQRNWGPERFGIRRLKVKDFEIQQKAKKYKINIATGDYRGIQLHRFLNTYSSLATCYLLGVPAPHWPS